MQHPNAIVLQKIYDDFSHGRFEQMLNACADNVTFQTMGKSKLAGKFTKADFISGYATKLAELSGGTHTLEVHDILANDRHAVVLGSSHLVRNGEKVQMRTVHVWRMENGKPVAFYEYPRDMYQFDQVWS